MNAESLCLISDEQLDTVSGGGVLKIAVTTVLLGPLFGSIYLTGVAVGYYDSK